MGNFTFSRVSLWFEGTRRPSERSSWWSNTVGEFYLNRLWVSFVKIRSFKRLFAEPSNEFSLFWLAFAQFGGIAGRACGNCSKFIYISSWIFLPSHFWQNMTLIRLMWSWPNRSCYISEVSEFTLIVSFFILSGWARVNSVLISTWRRFVIKGTTDHESSRYERQWFQYSIF